MTYRYVTGIREYATDHYEEDGWDVLVEAWSDEEIRDEIKGCRNQKAAINRMRKIMRDYKAYGDEIRATAF
jgi:hypothetical protein